MRHPTEGLLRRLLDEPAGVAEADRRHVAGCPQCLDRLAAVRADAARVGAALTVDTAGVDVDAAWQRLTRANTAPATFSTARTRRRRSFATLVRRPAVAAVAVAVVLAGAGTAAANDWLQIFRTERIAPLSLRTADLVALPDLTAYGDLARSGDPEVRSVADAGQAAKQSGLDVPIVSRLPRGVSGQPVYQVGNKVSATFTFSADRAAQAAAKAGKTLPSPPQGLDGSRVRLSAGPGLAELWMSANGTPALVVGRAVAPTAFSSGVPFETVRDYLLSLPGFPDDVAAQLRTFAADGSTLPLPVPADQVKTSTTQVDGVPATVLVSRDHTLAAVVWVQSGTVTAVGGALDVDEVLAVARALR